MGRKAQLQLSWDLVRKRPSTEQKAGECEARDRPYTHTPTVHTHAHIVQKAGDCEARDLLCIHTPMHTRTPHRAHTYTPIMHTYTCLAHICPHHAYPCPHHAHPHPPCTRTLPALSVCAGCTGSVLSFRSVSTDCLCRVGHPQGGRKSVVTREKPRCRRDLSCV